MVALQVSLGLIVANPSKKFGGHFCAARRRSRLIMDLNKLIEPRTACAGSDVAGKLFVKKDWAGRHSRRPAQLPGVNPQKKDLLRTPLFNLGRVDGQAAVEVRRRFGRAMESNRGRPACRNCPAEMGLATRLPTIC